MSSIKKYEGLISVDHRDSPGLTPEQANAAGMPVGCSGRGHAELPAYTCSHCTKVVIFNPLRTRAREWCAKCDRIICDECSRLLAATGECWSFEKFTDVFLDQADKGNTFDSISGVFRNPESGEVTDKSASTRT